jgi:hypothetical protein
MAVHQVHEPDRVTPPAVGTSPRMPLWPDILITAAGGTTLLIVGVHLLGTLLSGGRRSADTPRR